ncbi:MAG: glycosyltransferase [Acidobacteriota bacterium]
MSRGTSRPVGSAGDGSTPPVVQERGPAAGLRVALVHDWLTGMRGGEKVLEAIAAHLPGAPIYSLFAFPETLSEALRRHPIHTSFLQGYPAIRRHYRHFLPLFPAAIESFDLTDFDLIISTSHCVAKGIVPGPGAVHLCYCHSPMRYAWDQEHSYFPKRRGPVARARNLILTALRSWDVASIPRVDRFAANSSFVAERIRRYYARDAEVLPPPVDVEGFTAALQLAGDDPGTADAAAPGAEGYALAVSALVPYKRLDLAIAACEAAGIDLRIVGTGPEQARLERLGGARTRLLGRVDDEELRRLYRGARFFLQPGIEDFGIAAVEALASGTPVVAVDRGGVRDIVEDGVHGVLYRGSEVQDVAAAIDKFAQIGFNKLKLMERASSFSSATFDQRFEATLVRTLERHAELRAYPRTEAR